MDQMNLDAWAGRVAKQVGGISEMQAQRIVATLGGTEPVHHGALLPPLWHWFTFQPSEPMDALGADGHPRGTHILPPMPGKRRMWAGGALRFCGPLRIGDPIEKRSSLRSIETRQTGSGEMTILKVDHAIYGPRGLAVEEEQDIVYLDVPEAYTPPRKRPQTGKVVETLAMSETLLFRYSALTFNAHRIHYDRTYAQNVEHYPDLVVHGPLQATLLMRAATRLRGRPPSDFSYRGVHPMYVTAPLTLAVTEEDGALALSTGQEGHKGTIATAIWEETQ